AIESDFLEQSARERLQDAALDLRTQRVGIDDESAVVTTGHALHADRAGRTVDFGFECHRDVGLVVLVMHVRETAAAAALSLRRRGGGTRLPAKRRGCPPDDFDAPRIGQRLQAELDRIALRSGGKLVSEAL